MKDILSFCKSLDEQVVFLLIFGVFTFFDGGKI